MSQCDLVFDPGCRKCKRLSQFLDNVKQEYPEYHARPVPAFGINKPALLIVGLAPGLHGANATGRPFTGDYAGVLLYETLYKHGFSNKPVSVSLKDGLKLLNCRITNAVKCLPPENKPIGSEVNNCNAFLKQELKQLKKKSVILCLGQIAHKAVIKALSLKQSQYPFKHAACYELNDKRYLIDSYHCSRYNTQTKRLTESMFDDIFIQAKEKLQK